MAEQPAKNQDDEKTEEVSAEKEEKLAPKPGSHIIQLNADITIDTSKPLPRYDNGPVKAYQGIGTGSAPARLVVYVCENHLSPRINVGATYNKIINPTLINLVASGVVEWPGDMRNRYVLVYEDNLGDRIVPDDNGGGFAFDQDMTLNKIIRPMVTALLDMRDKDMVHGGIRPSNIFNGGSEKMERIILGDCLSVPPWANMSALYLPVDKAMANPVARGRGTPADDIYAFGTTLCVLLREVDPFPNADEETIIRTKLEHGSYIALTGKHRFTGGVLELLRGMLFDDVAQRWTIDEVQAWLDGRRLSPKQSAKRAKANRPIALVGKKYIYPEMLAMDMPKNVSEAAHIIEQDDLDQWLKRAVEDKPLTERVDKARDLANDKGKGPGYQQRLVTRVCIALDPGSPIRFKGINFMPEGLGPALTEAFVQKKEIKHFVDIFSEYFAMQWIDMNRNGNIDAGALMTRYDSCRAFIRQTGIGFGIERCIYYMDPCAPCLSEKVLNYYVRDPEDLMEAYEKISTLPSRPHYFMDRHIAAFLSVKDRKNIDPYLYDLGSEETYRRVLAELKVLATIQKRSQLGNYPGIAKWVASILDPVYERFHDRDLRKEVKDKIEQLKQKGDLTRMAALFDNPAITTKDSKEFFRAIHEYVKLRNERVELEAKLSNQKTYGLEAGHQAAAILACVLSAIVIIGSTFMAISKYIAG
jgi:hypothetical protein